MDPVVPLHPLLMPYTVHATMMVEEQIRVQVPIITRERRKVARQVCRFVDEDMQITVQVPVMRREKRKVLRQVVKMVQEDREVTVAVPVTTLVDQEVVYQVPVTTYDHACCGCCQYYVVPRTTFHTCRAVVQVPRTQMQHQTRVVKCCRPTVECEEHEVEVCVCRLEEQTRTVTCRTPHVQEVEDEVEVCVCRLEQQTRTVSIPRRVCETRYRSVSTLHVPVTTMVCREGPYRYGAAGGLRGPCLVEREYCQPVMCLPCGPAGGGDAFSAAEVAPAPAAAAEELLQPLTSSPLSAVAAAQNTVADVSALPPPLPAPDTAAPAPAAAVAAAALTVPLTPVSQWPTAPGYPPRPTDL